jgi:uncharacterized RDD family membrane protein YckC
VVVATGVYALGSAAQLDPGLSSQLAWASMPVVGLAYTSLEVIRGGTVGKMLFRLTIAWQDGSRAGCGQRMVRWTAKFYWLHVAVVEPFTDAAAPLAFRGLMYTIVVIGCLAAANDDHLAWHDEWSGTAVFRRGRRPVPAPGPPPLPMPVQPTEFPAMP